LLLVAFLLVNVPNCHLSLVLASVVQGDAVNCNTIHSEISTTSLFITMSQYYIRWAHIMHISCYPKPPEMSGLWYFTIQIQSWYFETQSRSNCGPKSKKI